MCVYLYIYNNYAWCTHIVLCKHKLVFWMRLIAINHLTALIKAKCLYYIKQTVNVNWITLQWFSNNWNTACNNLQSFIIIRYRFVFHSQNSKPLWCAVPLSSMLKRWLMNVYLKEIFLSINPGIYSSHDNLQYYHLMNN